MPAAGVISCYRFTGLSEPLPLGVLIAAQVPLATYLNERPSKFLRDVPAQVVPAPAAQSFLPASETPKHFSWPGCGFTGAATRAVEASAVAAPAMAMLAIFMVRNLLGHVDWVGPLGRRRLSPIKSRGSRSESASVQCANGIARLLASLVATV